MSRAETVSASANDMAKSTFARCVRRRLMTVLVIQTGEEDQSKQEPEGPCLVAEDLLVGTGHHAPVFAIRIVIHAAPPIDIIAYGNLFSSDAAC